MSRKVTIVNYYGSQDDSRCGYCSTTDSSQSHGMWAHCMKADDYQDLIDRGWRRSGQYCYKPNNRLTCCPSYTIKCDANAFDLSKSHKKVLKKMNTFLRTGKKTVSNCSRDADESKATENDINSEMDCIQSTSNESSALAESELITSNQPNEPIDIANVLDIIEKSSAISAEQIDTVNVTSNITMKSTESIKINGPDPTKPPRQKAKLLRKQRKLEKELAKADSGDTMSIDSKSDMSWKKTNKNVQQTLQSLIDAIPSDGQHKLQLKLVQSHAGATDTALELYRRYQVGVHKDPPEKVTRKSFESFLVRSPLQHETPENGPPCGYGSFHQQYWLDDKLIAVGVIDILPKCISSVYFFYDPEYSFLTLGTYGTLREMQFTQELNKTCASLAEYYMGFYIHSCPKMRYKGKLYPSYLLCPEVYSWHLLNDDILKTLDESKYSRFNKDPNAKDLNEFIPATDLGHLRLLVDYKYCLSYKDYREYKGTEGNDSDDDDYDNFCEYGKLVGKVLSQRLYLVT